MAAALPTATLLAGWGIAEAGLSASASIPASCPRPEPLGAGAFVSAGSRATAGDQSHLDAHGPLQV